MFFLAEKAKTPDMTVHARVARRPFNRNRRPVACCGVRLDDAVRLAPHHDRRREPPVTCERCVRVMDALDGFVE